MSVLRGNSLTTNYTNFRKQEIRQLVKELPGEKRVALLEQIRTRRFVFGEGDEELGRFAVKLLKGDIE